MFLIIKRLGLFILVTVLVIIIGVVTVVHQWASTDHGRLPPKTAVILYAINHKLVTLDMTPPRWLASSQKPSSVTWNDQVIPVSDGSTIPVRIYTPTGEGPFPMIIYYHGGAFLEGYGNIDTHDNITRILATQTKSIVISVGYRLAPTYMFPTAIEDSYDALLWAERHAAELNGDPSRMAVAGDSAGGNIATVVALMSRDRKGPDLKAQVLYYPVTTFLDEPLASREQYANGYYLLSADVMALARDLYAPEEQMWSNPYTSPLHATDLSGLPPALIVTAEYDPLRDEGEAYAERLADSGTTVYALRYQGVMHGFISFYEVMYSGKHGLNQTIAFLNQAFSGEVEPKPFQLSIVEVSYNWRDRLEAYGFAAYLLTQKTWFWLTSQINISK
jgi:acetyl esterase